MKFIKDIDVKNKKVILRLDLNVTIKDNIIADDTRIKKSIPTIKYLLDQGAHVLIMSHLGKVKTESDFETHSLKIVCDYISNLLNRKIYFVQSYKSEELNNALKENDLVMMENTRFADVPNKLESNCDMELAKYWASLGDVYINDAFGMTHRKHASNYGISTYIESGYGFLIEEELKGLKPVIDEIQKPFTVIMGGAKVDDKIQLIKSLLERCDYLIVGGGIANTFINAEGYSIGKSLYSMDYVEDIRRLLNKYRNKIYIPVDVTVEDGNNIKILNIDSINANSIIYDIGPKTIEIYKVIINKSETILLNGTVGLYENPKFRNGTEELLQILSECNAIKIAGGGDALTSINELGYAKSFDFLSTGGGATLDYIANRTLKCFDGE
jgi:phosphoglycerate kinase